MSGAGCIWLLIDIPAASKIYLFKYKEHYNKISTNVYCRLKNKINARVTDIFLASQKVAKFEICGLY